MLTVFTRPVRLAKRRSSGTPPATSTYLSVNSDFNRSAISMDIMHPVHRDQPQSPPVAPGGKTFLRRQTFDEKRSSATRMSNFAKYNPRNQAIADEQASGCQASGYRKSGARRVGLQASGFPEAR